MMVVILQQLEWSYQFEPPDNAAVAARSWASLDSQALLFLPQKWCQHQYIFWFLGPVPIDSRHGTGLLPGGWEPLFYNHCFVAWVRQCN